MARFKKVVVNQVVPANKVMRKIKRSHSKKRKVKRGGKRKISRKTSSHRRRSNKKQLSAFKNLAKRFGKKIRIKNGKWKSI